jgi:hypothetical protein
MFQSEYWTWKNNIKRNTEHGSFRVAPWIFFQDRFSELFLVCAKNLWKATTIVDENNIPFACTAAKLAQTAATFSWKRMGSFPCSNGTPAVLLEKQWQYNSRIHSTVTARPNQAHCDHWSLLILSKAIARSAKVFNCCWFTGLIHHHDRVAKP